MSTCGEKLRQNARSGLQPSDELTWNVPIQCFVEVRYMYYYVIVIWVNMLNSEIFCFRLWQITRHFKFL